MSVPFWFDANAYVKNKAAAMHMDATGLLSAFKDAGFSTDVEGLYNHFTQFGNSEKVSPNAFFNTDQYLYAKAAKYYDTTQVTDQQAKSMDLAMNQAGMTPWSHFQSFWDENYAKDGTFYNPSSSFDTGKYMHAKLALLQQEDPSWTMDQVVKAFRDSGLDPVTHYYQFGKEEGVKVESVSDGTPGATYQLTTGDDEFYGTAGDDYFHAKVDTLDDRDYIDGGAGNDTLYANVKAGNNDTVAPEITNVETVLFRAQTSGSGSGDNNVTAHVDAGNIRGMKVLGNDNSRAALSVEDVRVDSNEMTIRFSNTDPGDVDFSVYFDPQHLKSEASTTTGTLTLQLIDTVGALPEAKGGHNDPLYDNPYTGFKFTLNGKEYAVDFGTYNHTSDPTPSYDELIAQIQDVIAKDSTLASLGLTVELGDDFDAVVGIGAHIGEHVSGKQIIITSAQGALTGESWIASNGLPPTNSTSATFESASSTDCPLISTTVELDNAGRVQWDDANPCLPDDSIYGSQAGDLVIGSMATRGGVERFDVKVDEGSWLSSLSSTNNTLRYISVEAKDIDGDGSMGGRLFIGDSMAKDADYKEMSNWTTQARLLAVGESSGLNDVKVFDADGYTGDINIAARITEESNAKYLDPQDGVNRDDSAPRVNDDYYGNVAEHFVYRTGTGDDTINMRINGGVAADNDFALSIKTGGGKDLVNFNFENMTARESANQKVLQNVTIDTGDGDDSVWFWGGQKTYTTNTATDTPLRGSVVVNAGDGDDAVYVNQKLYNVTNRDGTAVDFTVPVVDQATASDTYNAVFVFNAGTDDADRSMLLSDINGAQSLNNDILGDTDGFAYTGASADTAITLTVTFKDIATTVDVATPNAAAGTLSAEEVNQAIINAINNDSVLSKLLVAKDGAGRSLIVESLINGQMALGDLEITFNNVTSAELDTAYGAQFGTIKGAADTYYDLTGSNSTTSQAIVNGGGGDDVIVFGPNNHQRDIMVLENNFGNDTVVGFVSGEDKINVAALGIASGFATLPDPAAAVNVGNNTVAVDNVGFAHAAGNTSGIYTVDEAKNHFTGTFTGTSIVAVKDQSDNIYTFFKVVDGAWTLLGSADTADETIAVGDFTVSNALDPLVGSTFAASDYHAGTGATFTGTADADVFNNLNNTDLKDSTDAPITTVEGLAGSDTFNVDGALSGVTLDGGAGADTLNIKVADATTDDVSLMALTGIETITVDEVHDLSITAMTTDAATTMTVTKANDVNITLTAGAATTIDASGATGTVTINGAASSAALALTGGSGAATFTGGDLGDTFTSGSGGGKFTGGAGDDIINLTVSGGAVDTVAYKGGSGTDSITGFVTTEDKLSFVDITVQGGGSISATSGTAVATGSVVAVALTNNTINVIDNGAQSLTSGGVESIAAYDDLSDVAAYLAEGYTSTADDDAAVFVINDVAGGKTYIYLFDEQTAGASTIQAEDLSLVGVLTEASGQALVAGDISA